MSGKRNIGDAGVAPLAGAWIEIVSLENGKMVVTVAPLAGAWIEIILLERIKLYSPESLPSRERGLKSLM